jgi:hypothetical protein
MRPAATGLLSGADVDPVTGGLLSIAQLQLVLRARRRPDPSADRLPGTRGPTQTVDPAPARAAHLPWTAGLVARRSVVVMAAHPGAGCSTVALAIADAAARMAEVQLVECAPAACSGLAAAAHAELGVTDGGWRRGRRGRVMISRPADGVPGVPPEVGPGVPEVLVVDVGTHDLAPIEGAVPVLVCHASVPGVRRAEQALASLDQAVVAAVGPGRWPGAVRASCGPRLRAVREAGGLVTVPPARRLQVDGVSSAGLPRGVAAAGLALWRLLDRGPRPVTDTRTGEQQW